MNLKTPAIFLGHGGGPLPLLKDPAHIDMLRTLSKTSRIYKSFHNPNIKAIVFVSAHYVATDEDTRGLSFDNGGDKGDKSTILVQCESRPKLLYDYYGFPQETYNYSLPNPGSVDLAERIASLINADEQPSCSADDGDTNESMEKYLKPSSILHAKLDKRPRGFDHGVFVPMLALNAPPTLPVVTVSLANDHDARAHIALGMALAPLRDEGVLLIGSGLAFHNLRAFFGQSGFSEQTVKNQAKKFDEELGKLIAEATDTEKTSDKEHTVKLLESWRKTLPHAEFCHPRAEHLMPLFVVLGSALASRNVEGKHSATKIPFDLMGVSTSHFIFD